MPIGAVVSGDCNVAEIWQRKSGCVADFEVGNGAMTDVAGTPSNAKARYARSSSKIRAVNPKGHGKEVEEEEHRE